MSDAAIYFAQAVVVVLVIERLWKMHRAKQSRMSLDQSLARISARS